MIFNIFQVVPALLEFRKKDIDTCYPNHLIDGARDKYGHSNRHNHPKPKRIQIEIRPQWLNLSLADPLRQEDIIAGEFLHHGELIDSIPDPEHNPFVLTSELLNQSIINIILHSVHKRDKLEIVDSFA